MHCTLQSSVTIIIIVVQPYKNTFTVALLTTISFELYDSRIKLWFQKGTVTQRDNKNNRPSFNVRFIHVFCFHRENRTFIIF